MLNLFSNLTNRLAIALQSFFTSDSGELPFSRILFKERNIILSEVLHSSKTLWGYMTSINFIVHFVVHIAQLISGLRDPVGAKALWSKEPGFECSFKAAVKTLDHAIALRMVCRGMLGTTAKDVVQFTP
ncbi:hypothetical protein PoB_005158700 [Plakobranchus ocellatus]|uniref:Uncharacterized protein n=1 Tax=Plakobranchus ocellatus TaxID=259542 RepID=A0AAV4C1C0_9GAST|nr:hypothetical protein PoB_005158700 [Plakobranchus ocellatus]